MSTSNPRGGHRSQHSLSELEHQGSWVEAPQQSTPAQPSARGPSPQELELLPAQRVPGRDSSTRDLTELEQQGSFTLTPDQSQSQLGNLDATQTAQTELTLGAEMARELARRKGAQAELERQYSQLQLHHQQVRLTSTSHVKGHAPAVEEQQTVFRLCVLDSTEGSTYDI